MAFFDQADEARQEAFIAKYEALMTRLGDDEMVVFSDSVHPTHQSRPAHGWFPKDQKTAVKSSSGRKRLNIQGVLDLETFQFTFVEAEKINAQTTKQMLENWIAITRRWPPSTSSWTMPGFIIQRCSSPSLHTQIAE